MPVTPSPAVRRAFDVLELLRDRPGESFTLSELARRLGMPRATCQAVLLALVERGYLVRQEPGLVYSLGPSCISLGQAGQQASPALALAGEEVRALSEATGLCVAAVVQRDEHVSAAVVSEGTQPFGVTLRPGQSVPVVPPFGAVFVAWQPEEELERWLHRCQPPLGGEQRRRYREAVAAVRQRGFSIAVNGSVAPTGGSGIIDIDPDASGAARARRDELIRNLAHSEYLAAELDEGRQYRMAQLSAPVFDHAGEVVLALLLLGPPYEVPAEAVLGHGERLVAAAARVTERAGGTMPPARG